jgi:SAM-dependent methyltransferase
MALKPMESAGALRENLLGLLWAPPLRRVLLRVPVVRRVYGGWSRRHPIDAYYGIDTSGVLAPDACAPDATLARHISQYAGSQPSIVRASLAALPDRERYAFVDLGCGKGRPLALATEFGFNRILGVEISPELAAIARANAATIAARHPGRTPIEVHVGDATTARAPGRLVVYYMYHPFDGSLVESLVAGIERQLDADVEHGFFVYYNPVHGDVLDRSSRFRRWSAEEVSYAPAELGYGPDVSDSVVIWQTQPTRYVPLAGADRGLVFRASPAHAGLATSS